MSYRYSAVFTVGKLCKYICLIYIHIYIVVYWKNKWALQRKGLNKRWWWQNSEQLFLGPAVHVLSPWRVSGCQDCKTQKYMGMMIPLYWGKEKNNTFQLRHNTRDLGQSRCSHNPTRNRDRSKPSHWVNSCSHRAWAPWLEFCSQMSIIEHTQCQAVSITSTGMQSVSKGERIDITPKRKPHHTAEGKESAHFNTRHFDLSANTYKDNIMRYYALRHNKYWFKVVCRITYGW